MASEYGIRPVWMVTALLVVTALTFAGYLLTQGAGTPPVGAPVPLTVGTAAPRPQPTTSTSATTSATWAPSGLQPAVAAFLTAWSTADPAARQAALVQTATGVLADQLTVTDPEEVPPPCVVAGALQVVDRTPGAVLVTVATSCEGTVWLALQADETSASGWRVSAVGKERSWIP